VKTFKNCAAAAVGLVGIGMMLAPTAQARVVLATRGPNYQQAPSSHEFVFEGALAEPMGDQDGDFWTTNTGFGASTGYQFGVRIRQYMWQHFAVSPAFHYTRLGAATGVTDLADQVNLAYDISTSHYRYGLDFQTFLGRSTAPMRLLLTGGIALSHNMYRDALQYNGVFKASVDNPSASVGVGLQMKNIELTAEYSYNRFRTNKLSFDGATRDYNWDTILVRAGLSFGR